MVSGNQGKIGILKRISVLWNGRFPISEKRQESVTIKALRVQIKAQESIIEKQSNFIEELTEQVQYKQETNMQEKIIDTVKEFFMPSRHPHPQTKKNNFAQQTLITESGKQVSNDLTDEQLKNLISDTNSSRSSRQSKIQIIFYYLVIQNSYIPT